tara:strand:- start:253 stop:804 length:552 start_codon:yes stop_codon:yes gene_type:complete
MDAEHNHLLQKIRYKKVRQKLRYLQSELEETKIIYKHCLDTFNNDFAEHLLDEQTDISAPADSEDVTYDKLDTDVDDETIKDVYRKVAAKTHPDKKEGDEEEFKRLNQANKNKDFGTILEMADEYDIPIESSEFMMLEMAKQNKSIVNTIENMKLTWAWHYVHLEGKEKEGFKTYVLQQLNVV